MKRGVFLEGVTEETITNSLEALKILKKGDENRHTGSTMINDQSSRSHSVLTITLHTKKLQNEIMNATTSKFHFVDLAGSERQKLTKTSGKSLKEAGNINKSLTVLGSVINSLTEEKRSKHIRYRDSKLTFILKDSIGGNSKTFMIANVSPAASNYQETLSTLKFAQRAKLIKNKASINQESIGSTENLRKEIQRLREELANAKNLISMMEEVEKEKLKERESRGIVLSPKSENDLERNLYTKELLQHNKAMIELEIILDESLDLISETERHLNIEISRKDEFLEMFTNLCTLHKTNDTKLRELVSIYDERTKSSDSDHKLKSENVRKKNFNKKRNF